ncbi:uncharacterized protein [Physcomitrium patens]|nr:uncharacterized protein LOC112283170 isoform X1 [Physcomitrium patens]PNR52903.1 hypothetical protein PHYPA_009278 [Physcomitrium patens]|eukprot:XP_024377330.1 uncharacterized protein LOC112283170 isoform X1 [Physcomitrella patens]
MAALMVETPIAFGLTMAVCLALFFYCWRIRKFRNRLTSVQVAATPNEVNSGLQIGIKQDVIKTFPTVMTKELKIDIKDGLQCPICLVEYEEAEVLRKLPLCGHVFHIRCVDSWLEKQVTCPVCRIVLAGVSKLSLRTNRQQNYLNHYRFPSSPRSVTVEVAGNIPAWVLVNRPLPLPPAIPERPSVDSVTSLESSPLDIDVQPSANFGMTGESPLLIPHDAGWGAIYLQRSHGALSFKARTGADIAIETKECVDHSSISERWMTESFSFGISTCEDVSSTRSSHNVWQADSTTRHSSWSSHSHNSLCDIYQPTMKNWESEEVFESLATHHQPLTMSPERCSFEFLPIITGTEGDCILKHNSYAPKPERTEIGSSPHSYSQL